MSQNIIKLDNPIKVTGKEVSELTYDYFEITNDLYLEATMRSSRVGNTVNSAAVREMNEALALCFGKAAIIAVNPAITWEELNNLKGLDLLRVANVGRFFITGKRENSTPTPSGEQSGGTPSDSTQAPETSEE